MCTRGGGAGGISTREGWRASARNEKGREKSIPARCHVVSAVCLDRYNGREDQVCVHPNIQSVGQSDISVG